MRHAIVLFALLTTIGCKSEADREWQDLTEAGTKYRETMCKCPDHDCVLKVKEGQSVWQGAVMRQLQTAPVDTQKRMAALIEEMQACAAKADAK